MVIDLNLNITRLIVDSNDQNEYHIYHNRKTETRNTTKSGGSGHRYVELDPNDINQGIEKIIGVRLINNNISAYFTNIADCNKFPFLYPFYNI